MNFENDIHELIVKLFAGETSPAEKAKIDDWLNSSRQNKNLFNDLKDIWINAETGKFPDDYDVEEAIRNFIHKTRTIKESKKSKPLIYTVLRYAAVFLLALAIPLTWWLAQKPGKSSAEAFTTISCAYGDKTSIVLPDSSLVWVNSGSQITFSNSFDNGSRQLFLEGEAYFSVKTDPENPFIVKTSEMNVKVLGTEFNLKAYSDEEAVAVTLISGSLQVSNSQEMAMVTPGQKLIYEKTNHTISIEDLSDLSPETEWINGRLVFRNESLEELERKLERWFDVEIEFYDELVKQRRFSGTLERESILEVISYFGSSQYVDYAIDGNIITFFSEVH
jgi:ferric-dicitrate binding protein FerR (iron transport regulator)